MADLIEQGKVIALPDRPESRPGPRHWHHAETGLSAGRAQSRAEDQRAGMEHADRQRSGRDGGTRGQAAERFARASGQLPTAPL